MLGWIKRRREDKKKRLDELKSLADQIWKMDIVLYIKNKDPINFSKQSSGRVLYIHMDLYLHSGKDILKWWWGDILREFRNGGVTVMGSFYPSHSIEKIEMSRCEVTE